MNVIWRQQFILDEEGNCGCSVLQQAGGATEMLVEKAGMVNAVQKSWKTV